MDYEKKYKDALEKAKEVYNRKDATDGGKLILESMFPELKESEDEKMREMAIKAIYAPEAQSCIKSWGINPDDVIAWLEKQGEKESDPRYENLEEILAADDIYQMSMNDEMVQEAKEKAVNSLSGMCIGRLLGLEKQGKQKSTKNIMNVWKDMRLEVYQQASGNRHEPNYSDDTTKMFSLNDIDEIIEKMSEQKPIISNNALREGIAHFGITQYQIDNWLKKYVDVEGNYYDGVLRALRVDELYKLQEKQGKQKPADKAQPKFKVGDWITNSIETVQITNYDIDYGYQVDYKGNLQHRNTDIIEKEYHLWTIQDAKDGDVLVDSYAIIIFRKIGNHVLDDVVDFYICYSFEKGIIIQRHNLHCGSIDSVFFKPATKEQRDMFFQKMHEAGYEWDFEVKELNKIEKKPACSEEEKQLLLKDICARLPYKVRCKCVSGLGGGETEKGVLKYVGNCYGVISNYYEGVPLHSGFVNNVFYPIENIKPYLRPLTNMTEEEFQKLRSICPHSMINKTNVTGWFVGINGSDYGRISRVDEISEFIDWLNAHHFDFRGLIEKGLALEAPEGMYN